MRFILLLCLTLALCVHGFAQDIAPGKIIQPKAALPLRTAPPSGLFGVTGNDIGVASPSTQYQVLEQKTFSTVTGGETWLRIKAPDSRVTGWIYSGSKAEPLANVNQLSR